MMHIKKTKATQRLFRWIDAHPCATITLVFFLYSASIECASFFLLTFLGSDTKPLLFDYTLAASDKTATALPGQLYLSSLDPLLGYTRNFQRIPEDIRGIQVGQKISGFIVYRGDVVESNDGGAIATLGGSTTDGAYYKNNWPKQLSQLYNKQAKYFDIYNGGVAGYTTNQELIKLIRDVLTLNPRLIISLDGVNEFVSYSVDKYPMIHPYQQRIFQKILNRSNYTIFPNTLDAIQILMHRLLNRSFIPTNVSLGVPSTLKAWEQWRRNIIVMRSVSDAFGIEYRAFLQPILGYGPYALNENERLMLQNKGETYLGNLREFYIHAAGLCHELSFCFDITDVFQNDRGVYMDARHPNEAGNRIVAQRIMDELTKKHLTTNEMDRKRPVSSDLLR